MAKKTVASVETVDAPQNSFQAAVDPAKRFAQDSIRLVKRCTKPDAKGTYRHIQHNTTQHTYSHRTHHTYIEKRNNIQANDHTRKRYTSMQTPRA